MTPQEYWDGDPALVKWYREAYRYRNEQVNREAWLHGLYVYNAVCCASPLFNPYAKRPKAKEYPTKPYELFETAQSIKAKHEEATCTDAATKFAAWADKFNKRKRGDSK